MAAADNHRVSNSQRTSVLGRPYGKPAVWYVGVIVVLVVGGAWVVHAAGGTRTAFPHVMYFPVVLAALVFGARGAIGVGVAAGIAIGPWMPLDVAADVGQPTFGWLVRTGFLIGVGIVVGEGRRHLLGLVANRQQFVSAISHEVRTPLAGIIGFSQLLADRYHELPEAERREFASLVHHEVTQLSDIVDGYIISARLEDHALVIDPRFVDLRVLVREVVDRLPMPGDVLLDDVGDDLTCWADPLRVRQILRSVLSCISANGGRSLQIRGSRTHSEVVVAIEATGAEIDSDISHLALESGQLSALHSGTRTLPVALGLGVPVRLAELMGGALRCGLEMGRVRLDLAFPIPR